MGKDNRITKRQEAIKELISLHAISDQQALVRLLKLKYDIETTQAVVSRDLRQLGVVKHPVGDAIVYELKSVDAAIEILRLGVISVEHNETLIVIKTLPALAAFVADYLDAHHKTLNVLGTMAGENIVFAAPKNTKELENVYKNICKLLHIKINKDLI